MLRGILRRQGICITPLSIVLDLLRPNSVSLSLQIPSKTGCLLAHVIMNAYANTWPLH